MYVLAQSMALFWTLAEGVILLFLRWGLLLLGRERESQKYFLAFSMITFAFLALLVFLGESIFGRVLNLEHIDHLTLYRWALWNFFCTLWIVLEGVIMIYVIRIYGILKVALQGRASASQGIIGDPSGSACGIPLLVCSLFGLYLFYESALLFTVGRQGLGVEAIYHISLFYIRICGIFWIVFEWIVAILGIKTFFALKGMEESTR
jgi:hypothetical protein